MRTTFAVFLTSLFFLFDVLPFHIGPLWPYKQLQEIQQRIARYSERLASQEKRLGRISQTRSQRDMVVTAALVAISILSQQVLHLPVRMVFALVSALGGKRIRSVVSKLNTASRFVLMYLTFRWLRVRAKSVGVLSSSTSFGMISAETT